MVLFVYLAVANNSSSSVYAYISRQNDFDNQESKYGYCESYSYSE